MRIGKLAVVAACVLTAGAPAFAMTITPTFAANINSDSNAAAIKAAINAAIAIYQADFTDSITVNITFQEGAGLGGSSTAFFNVTYASYLAALIADKKTSDDNASNLPTATQFSTFFGVSNINVKSANLRAVGLAGAVATDGTITLNTSLTTPGSSGTTSQYSLMAVVEHEIDEVLGLGSALPNKPNGDPFPEDLFRYTSTAGTRSWDTLIATVPFFSIDGTVDLARFHQQNGDGGDYGDWQTGVAPPQVQDWQATIGSNPTLGVELRALDVIGFDSAVPEPGTGVLLAAALAFLGVLRRQRGKTAA